MSLATRTVTAPIAFEPALGDEALDRFHGLAPALGELIRGTAGSSPYLRGLLMSEGGWLGGVLDADPAEVLEGLKAPADAPADARAAADPGAALRRAKRRLHLYVALGDLGGMWGLEEVTGALSDFAGFAVKRALDALVAAELRRGRLPGCGEADLADACGMVVLAMGKMGARELNYSSDIDLIVLFDETRHDPRHFETLRTRFIRITRALAKLLSEVTGDGYVFRTDLRLRPDPSVTPVCLPIGAAERYYESLGRTWERAAFIKARVVAGDRRAGEAFLNTLRPFVWRRHLDFAAIADAHDMRLRIREHKGLGGPIALLGHDMKLGRGGIREIEFFAQTRQIIAGGRDPDLRRAGTCAALAALAEKGWIEPAVATTLSDAYRQYRRVEHRLQMIADAQTHLVPASDEGFARFAALCGAPDAGALRRSLTARLEEVNALIERFFEGERAQTGGGETAPDREAERMLERWRHHAALRNARARAIFLGLQPRIMARVATSPDPDATLRQFETFIAALPAGVQLFSLFEANPMLLDLLIDICGSAPGLARYLSRHANILDAVIGGSFFEPPASAATLAEALVAHLRRIDDYELKLDATRRWMKEQHFKIGVQHLKGMLASEAAAAAYSALADAVLEALLPVVAAEFSRRHGRIAGARVALLAMGSLGAGSLTATSDLDLIVIYDAAADAVSDGRRGLGPGAYFARFTQALVSAVAAPMPEGRLYEIDMRLRPSGRKGPVATAISGFRSYQRNEAWTWEHLALTRARVVAGNATLGREIEALRGELLARPRDRAAACADVADLRRRIAEASDPARMGDPWETKLGPGRMLEIELVAQTTALLGGNPARGVAEQLAQATRDGFLAADEGADLGAAYRRLTSLRQIARLTSRGAFDARTAGGGARALLLGETGLGDIDTLQERLGADAARAASVFSAFLERGAAGLEKPGANT